MREDTNEVSANEMLLIFESNPVNEGLARVTAASFCTQLNPTLEEIADLKTAVSEAVTNCIIHGYEGRRGRIEMHLSYRERELYAENSQSAGIRQRPGTGYFISDAGIVALALFAHGFGSAAEKKRKYGILTGKNTADDAIYSSKFPTKSYIGGYRRAGYGEQKYGIESVPKISSRYAGALSGEVSSAGGCKASGHDGEKDNCNFRRDGI